MSDGSTIDAFLDSSWAERGLAHATLQSYRTDLEAYARWLEDANNALLTADSSTLQSYLAVRLREDLSASSVARALSAIRTFYRYAKRRGLRTDDPCERVFSPKLPRHLPSVLSEKEVERLLAAPNCETAYGLRDRAMLELMYACGLRVSELVSLQRGQVDLKAAVLRLTGKGAKERLVPFGECATDWLEQYLRDSRPILMKGRASSEDLFVTRRGRAMSRQAFWQNLRKLARTADIAQPFSPHTLRHAFATHLLNHGADLRVVQMLLGHSDLGTTQIYTHLAHDELKTLHQTHHPRG